LCVYVDGCDTFYDDLPLGDGFGKCDRAPQYGRLWQFACYNPKTGPCQSVYNPCSKVAGPFNGY